MICFNQDIASLVLRVIHFQMSSYDFCQGCSVDIFLGRTEHSVNCYFMSFDNKQLIPGPSILTLVFII